MDEKDTVRHWVVKRSAQEAAEKGRVLWTCGSRDDGESSEAYTYYCSRVVPPCYCCKVVSMERVQFSLYPCEIATTVRQGEKRGERLSGLALLF